MVSKGLSKKDLEEARSRAISAGELPEEVRQALLVVLERMDTLPKEIRTLQVASLSESNWVVTHLVPSLALHLSDVLLKNNTETGRAMSARFDAIADIVGNQTSEAIQMLIEPSILGEGSRKANQSRIHLLRVLDLGILGMPVVAAIYARVLGLLDTSNSLVGDAHMSVQDCCEAAKNLGDKPKGSLSEADKKSEWWVGRELFSPLDFNSRSIESISPRSG